MRKTRPVQLIALFYMLLMLLPLLTFAPEYDTPIVTTVETDANNARPVHMGRKSTFFAVNRSWVFYVVYQEWVLYTSSNDSATEGWNTPIVFGQYASDGWAVTYDEQRNYVHVVFTGLYEDLFYRRGTPNATLEQIVWDSTATIDATVWHCQYPSIVFMVLGLIVRFAYPFSNFGWACCSQLSNSFWYISVRVVLHAQAPPRAT